MRGKIVQGAQVGCGAFARGQDLVNMRKNPKVECKWCCDISAARAEEAARDFGVPRHTSNLDDILGDPEVDFVKIATTHDTHLEIVERAARAGKHIFCEKPLAMDEAEAYKIIRAARRGGIKLCVNLNRRMSPALNSLRGRWSTHKSNPVTQPWRYVEASRAPIPGRACQPSVHPHPGRHR